MQAGKLLMLESKCAYDMDMATISLADLSSDPARFIRRVSGGESLLVVDGDRLLVEIRPAERPPRPSGLCAGGSYQMILMDRSPTTS
jgi:antitoxin (DNA-binding transcriptional repressor) of toxin-antitoxin stability system